MYRYAQFKDLPVDARGDLKQFRDGASVSNWATEAMQAVKTAGVNVQLLKRRADIHCCIWHSKHYSVAAEVVQLDKLAIFGPNEPSGFKDVPAGQWYTEAVVWAKASGIVNGYENGKFEPMQDICREELAAILYRYAHHKICGLARACKKMPKIFSLAFRLAKMVL